VMSARRPSTVKELPPCKTTRAPESVKTGSWRSFKPVFSRDECTKCGMCWTYCPEGAVKMLPDGYFEVDYEYCKGCGVCANECPTKSIQIVRE